MTMITVKTADLIGPALDLAVAEAEGLPAVIEPPIYGTGPRVFLALAFGKVRYRPSTDWAQGGPMIEKYRAQVWYRDETHRGEGYWHAMVEKGRYECTEDGDTLLVAACRAIVAAKMGDEVQVPAELVR